MSDDRQPAVPTSVAHDADGVVLTPGPSIPGASYAGASGRTVIETDDADPRDAAGPWDFGNRWKTMTSAQKLRVKRGAAVGALLLVGYGAYSASHSDDTKVATAPQASKLNMGAGLRGDSLEQKFDGNFKKIEELVKVQADRVTAIEQGKTPIVPSKSGGLTPADAAAVDASADGGDLPEALPGAGTPAGSPHGAKGFPPSPTGADRELASSAQLPPPPSGAPAAPPAPPIEKYVGGVGSALTPVSFASNRPGGAAADNNAPSGGDTGQPSGSPAAKGVNGSKKKLRTIYLPPGFMRARLLTGGDLLGTKDGTSNPEPVIARVQAPAVLPNDVKANLSGCFVIGNATGSLAKERVEIQAVSISCVDFDERSVIDQAFKGFFVDTDGKKGLSGKVVTRFGATLARQFIAGTIAGIAKTVESTSGNNSISPLGSVRTFNTTQAATAGIAGGFGKASDDLSQFYLELARQAGPVVEIGAGKDVVIVVQEGVTLQIKQTAGVRDF